MSGAGVITNMNGLDNHASGGYCGGVLFGLVPTPLSGFFGDVYNNIIPRDAISGINGITDSIPAAIEVGGHPFGTNCLWHKVRYNGPFVTEDAACAYTGSASAATEARNVPLGLPSQSEAGFMLVKDHDLLPSEDMWYNTSSTFSKTEWIPPTPIVSFPDNGYYILWGKYGIDDAGVNFKLVQFLNNNTPSQVSDKGVCSF